MTQDRNDFLALADKEVVEVCSRLRELEVVNGAILDLLEIQVNDVPLAASNRLLNQVRIVGGPAHVRSWLRSWQQES